MNQINQLKNRVLQKKGTITETGLTNILDMARGFSCLGEIIGREYEIRDKDGGLVYTIKQKPMKVKQMNNLLKEFHILKRIDHETESAKWGGKKRIKGMKRPRRR